MITLISGTNRPDANSRKVVANVQSIYDAMGVENQILDLADMPAEIFSPESYETKPESFALLSDAVVNATGLVLTTPEYNGGMPGVLKYFIDMLPFPESFEGRPVCFIGCAAGMWGALRPVEQLQQIFGYRNALIYPERVFIPGVFKAFNEEGKLADEKLIERLEAQANGFVDFVEKLKQTELRKK